MTQLLRKSPQSCPNARMKIFRPFCFLSQSVDTRTKNGRDAPTCSSVSWTVEQSDAEREKETEKLELTVTQSCPITTQTCESSAHRDCIRSDA